MWAVITWPFFSFTRKVVFGRVWMTSPSIWIGSSLVTAPYIRPHGGADWSMKCTALAISRRSARNRAVRILRAIRQRYETENDANSGRRRSYTVEVALGYSDMLWI